MDDRQRAALRALHVDWAPTLEDVWRPPRYHVPGLQRVATELILDGMATAASADSSPLGVVVIGDGGSGKTHMLSPLREEVQGRGGYFFVVEVLNASGFWLNVADGILSGLARKPEPDPGGPAFPSQLQRLMVDLADRVGAPPALRGAVAGISPLTKPALDVFIDLLRKADRRLGLECQDVARALALYAAVEDFKAQDIGYDFLSSDEEQNDGDRARWGIGRRRHSQMDLIRDMSRLIAFTGRPTMLAIDQIDQLITESEKSTAALDDSRQDSLVLEQLAGGLMALRELTRRTLTVLTCLDHSWRRIRSETTVTVRDRFQDPVWLREIPSAELGRELVARRFAARFEAVNFVPPHATWPVAPSAFEASVNFTPRELLRAVDTHVKRCLRTDQLGELTQLEATRTATVEPAPAVETTDFDPSNLDTRYALLLEEADPASALDGRTEDAEVPALLAAGLEAWQAVNDPDGREFKQDPLPGAGTKPAVHARLRKILDDRNEDEVHWALRAIAPTHHHIAVLNRIRKAASAAGLAEEANQRHLVFLRTDDWNKGPKTRELTDSLAGMRGVKRDFTNEDVRTLIALRRLAEEVKGNKENENDWLRWLAVRRPTDRIGFLRDTLADQAVPAGGSERADEPLAELNKSLDDPLTVTLGTTGERELPVAVGLEALRRHTAIFAGSGSGKTVLIRRMIEECALKGVSAIVLDPNNDLARLGDGWPEPPYGWYPDDQERAARYLDAVDVVVWTPRRDSGRPLSFQPLPDFAELVGDPDEFGLGVDAAVQALLPRAKIDANTNKAHLAQAVLRQALTYYARSGRSRLEELIDLLDDLPEDVSSLDNAPKIATDLAQVLRATMVNDPLFGGGGTPVDPAVLLTPAEGKLARISVISFIGLPNDEQRQSFVNQLQLALFGWIKRNPAGDRPLGALFVMDEAQTFAPSGTMTACTASTLALASQARKYGLGLVFATQAPKGLNNRIPGNAATQLFGLLNSPAQIAAAREMARAKGSDVPDIARLGTGQFYAAVEGADFVKLQTPMCLSHHPRSPLVAEDVLLRSRTDV
jgi:DNA helicase HerA-like ATPase